MTEFIIKHGFYTGKRLRAWTYSRPTNWLKRHMLGAAPTTYYYRIEREFVNWYVVEDVGGFLSAEEAADSAKLRMKILAYGPDFIELTPV